MLVQRLWWNSFTIRCLWLSGFQFLGDNKGKWTLALPLYSCELYVCILVQAGCLWLSVEGHHIPASSKEAEQSRGLPHCCLPQSNKVPLGSAYCCLACCAWLCTDVWCVYSCYEAVSTPFYKRVIGHGELTYTWSGALIPQSSAAYPWCHQDWDRNLLHQTVGYTKCWTISSDTGTSCQPLCGIQYNFHSITII